MEYLHWDEKTITDFSERNIADMYSHGYVFTRIGKGVMHQTRSVRVDLAKFELTSENRRILKKVGGDENTNKLALQSTVMPVSGYDWPIGKLAKDFYEKKFGAGIMSAAKVKEMLTDSAKSNFNSLLTYNINAQNQSKSPIGYAICYMNNSLLHYSYPFYDLKSASKDMGLGMMTTAITFAKEEGLKYVYLGSLQRPGDTYKLQFEGLEWFDGKAWQTDIEVVKKILATTQ
jgi:arginyl-tRNA--protein-N-Asp/Glu arginylyltransferase